MAQNLIPVVEGFFARWEKNWDEFLQSYRDTFAEDTVYIAHPDIPPLTGAEAAIPALEPFHAIGVEAIAVEITNIVQVGNDVWMERIDYMINASGERYCAIPIAARMTFDEEGKLVRWADYWDMRGVLATAPAPEA